MLSSLTPNNSTRKAECVVRLTKSRDSYIFRYRNLVIFRNQELGFDPFVFKPAGQARRIVCMVAELPPVPFILAY